MSRQPRLRPKWKWKWSLQTQRLSHKKVQTQSSNFTPIFLHWKGCFLYTCHYIRNLQPTKLIYAFEQQQLLEHLPQKWPCCKELAGPASLIMFMAFLISTNHDFLDYYQSWFWLSFFFITNHIPGLLYQQHHQSWFWSSFYLTKYHYLCSSGLLDQQQSWFWSSFCWSA